MKQLREYGVGAHVEIFTLGAWRPGKVSAYLAPSEFDTRHTLIVDVPGAPGEFPRTLSVCTPERVREVPVEALPEVARESVLVTVPNDVITAFAAASSRIARVLSLPPPPGAAPGRWRQSSPEAHALAAIGHIVSHLRGNRDEDHIAHAAARLVLAMGERIAPPQKSTSST